MNAEQRLRHFNLYSRFVAIAAGMREAGDAEWQRDEKLASHCHAQATVFLRLYEKLSEEERPEELKSSGITSGLSRIVDSTTPP